jgi:hypothetical protein
MDQVCGKELKGIRMLVNGSSEKQMDMGLILGLTEIDIKESLKNVLNTDKDCKNLQMVIYIKEHTLTENLQDMENTIG